MREYKTRLNPKGVIKIETVYSRFRMRMKAVSISLLMIFFSQQVSWACGYNLSLLVNPLLSPRIYQDHGEFNRLVAKRVYSLVKPSFRDKAQELKSAYQWLKTPSTQTVPCSAYVLYNLLQSKGIKPKIEDISASLISLDLKAGNLKPPFTASRIDNSLYALAKTAENQGLHLYPARLNSITPELLNFLNSQTPFIAHLNYSRALDEGHFVLVTGIDPDKVHFFYDKGDTFLPLEKFLEEFSGYCLLSFPSVGDSLSAVSDAEAQGVLGAKSYKGVSVDYTKLFKEPSTKDLLIGFGVSVGTMFGGSMLGGMMKGQGLSFGKAFAGLGAGIAQAEISKASVNFSVQQFKMKPLYAQIVGYGVSGAMSGAIAGIGNDTQFKIGQGDNFWNNHSIMRGAIMGSVQGGMQGTGSVMAYQGIKNTSFYQKNPFIARQVAGLVGGAVGYMGFYAMTGAMRMNVNIDKNNNKVFGDEQKGTQVTYSDGSMHTRMSTFDNGGAGIINNVKYALADSSFLSSMISQGTALGVEWIAGPKYAKYSRILGQGIGSVAGGYATGNGISPWKMMMSGALSGGISLGLGYLGGEVGPDGKNKLGLTDIQMAGIEWLGTATLYSGIGAAMSKTPGTTFADAFGQRFSEFSTDYVSFGRTSPLYTKGAGGWSSFMYNQKIADFGGFANYKANADYSMKLQGYKSWCKFVDDGKAANLLPSFSNSLVRYASTSLHYGAVSNAVATVGWFPKSVTNFLGIAKHEIINKKDSDILYEILTKQSGMEESRVRTIDAEVKENNELNSSSSDSKNSWIGISEVDSNVVVGRSFFTLGGSEVVYDNGEFVSLNHHLRRALEIDGTQVGNSLYHLGDKYKASDLQSLDGGSGGLLISTKRPGEAYTVNLFNLLAYAQNSGYVSGRVSESTRDGTGKYYVGAVSNKHEKGKPTITDIFTAHQVTPKKFWFDKKTPINTGVTLAVYNRAINTAQGPTYLGKDNNGLYPAAGFGYSESGGIVTKDGDNVRRSKDEMVVELSVLGQGVETKSAEIAESSAARTEKQEQSQQPSQTVNMTGEKEQSKSLELLKSEDVVTEEAKKDPEKELKKFEVERRKGLPGRTPDSFMYNGKNYGNTPEDYKRALGAAIEDALVQDPDNIALQKAENFLSEKYENVESAEVILDRYNKAMEPKKEEISKSAKESNNSSIQDSLRKEYETAEAKIELAKGAVKSLQKESKVQPGVKDENLNKAEDSLITALMDFSKARTKLEGYGELIQSAEVELAAKDKATVSKPAEQVEAGENTITTTTTTTTPKITTAITIINQDDLFKLSSRDKGPFKVGGSTYSEMPETKVSSVPLPPADFQKMSPSVQKMLKENYPYIYETNKGNTKVELPVGSEKQKEAAKPGGNNNAVVVQQIVIKEEKHDTNSLEAQKQELTSAMNKEIEQAYAEKVKDKYREEFDKLEKDNSPSLTPEGRSSQQANGFGDTVSAVNLKDASSPGLKINYAEAVEGIDDDEKYLSALFDGKSPVGMGDIIKQPQTADGKGEARTETTYPNFDYTYKAVTSYNENGEVIGRQLWKQDEQSGEYKLEEFRIKNGGKEQVLLPGEDKGESYGTYDLKSVNKINKDGTETSRVYKSTNGRPIIGRVYNNDGIMISELRGNPPPQGAYDPGIHENGIAIALETSNTQEQSAVKNPRRDLGRYEIIIDSAGKSGFRGEAGHVKEIETDNNTGKHIVRTTDGMEYFKIDNIELTDVPAGAGLSNGIGKRVNPTMGEVKEEKEDRIKITNGKFQKNEFSSFGMKPVDGANHSDAEKGLPSTQDISKKPEESPKSENKISQGNNDLRKQIEQFVMTYDDQDGNLRHKPNGIEMPPGYSVSVEVNKKNRGDVIDELYLYNSHPSPFKINDEAAGKQEKVIGGKEKAYLPGEDANAHVKAYEAAMDGNKSSDQNGGKAPRTDKTSVTKFGENPWGLGKSVMREHNLGFAFDSGLGEKSDSEEPPDYFKETTQPKVEIPVEQRLGKIESYDFDVAFGSADYANGLPNTKEKVLNERAKIQDERNAKFERDAEYDKKINVMPNYQKYPVDPKELGDGKTKSLKWKESTVIPSIDTGRDVSFVPPSRFGELSKDLQDKYLIAVNNSPGFKKEASDNFFKLLNQGQYSNASLNSGKSVTLIAYSEDSK